MNSGRKADAVTVPPNSVDVVVVNWNADDQLAACIASVRAFDPDVVAQLIVVDNASTDTSLDNLPDWTKLTVDRVGRNLGFGRACNRGAAQGTAPLVLLLNPDTRLTEPAISAAAAFLLGAGDARYGVCGIMLRDDTGQATRHCARFPTLRTFASQILGLDKLFPTAKRTLLMEDFDHLSDRQVDHVQGAFYMIRRDIFETVGGFDEDYFVYFEDVDLSLRVSRTGWRTRYLANIEAYHRGGGTSAQIKVRARFYGIEARLLYSRKHFGWLANIAHIGLTFTIEPMLTILWYGYRYGVPGLAAGFELATLVYGNAFRLLRRPAATETISASADGGTKRL